MSPHPLATEWRSRAVKLRAWGALDAARFWTLAADELDAYERERADELLDLTSAAVERGVHPDTISRYLRAGRLANHGHPGSPRVRRGDLFNLTPPKRPAPKTNSGLPDLAAEVAGQGS